MTDILIRNIPDAVAQRLSVIAAEQGMDRHTMIRNWVLQHADRASQFRPSYGFHALSATGARLFVQRQPVQGVCERQIQQCSVEQERVYRVVVSCMERNSIGDYDLAYRLLRNVFDEVVCVD